MAQLPTPPSMAGFTPEQMQQVMAFILQQQAGASASSVAEEDSLVDEAQTAAIDNQVCPPTPVKTPPRKGRKQYPPATPKAKANTTPMKILPASPAAHTPSSKMAQLTLDGRKLSSTPSLGDGDGTETAKKKTVPTGYDPSLVYGNVQASSKSDRACSAQALDDDDISTISDEFPYNPMDALPKEDPPQDDVPSFAKRFSASKSRRKRNDPTTERWMNTRWTRSNTEPSPPPAYRSPKKNARPASPVTDKKSSPSGRRSPKKKARIASPFESPPHVKKSASDPFQQWLDAAPPGIPRSTLEKMMKSPLKETTVRDPFVDDEAMDEAADGTDDAQDVEDAEAVEEDGDDSGSDLGGFIQRDDEIEYDSDAPVLPDDDDAESAVEDVTPRRRRIYKRANSQSDDTGDSEIEIVPTTPKPKGHQSARPQTSRRTTASSKAVKGKGRAASPPAAQSTASAASGSASTVIPKAEKGKGRAVSPPAAQSTASAASGSASAIIPKVNKGKGRAATPRVASGSGTARPTSQSASLAEGSNGEDYVSYIQPEWKKTALPLQRVSRGLHPGSSAVDVRARVFSKLQIDSSDEEAILTWDSVPSLTLAAIKYYDGIALLPANCQMEFKHIADGLPHPMFDSLMDPEYVNTDNLLTGVKFVRHGPYINDSIVNPSEVIAVDITGSSTTSRARLVLKDTRAPAVSITPGVIRWWKLDTPSLGLRPVFFVNLSPIDGHFDRVVALLCMVFGTPVLHCQSWRNAIRFASLPAFDRPASSTAARTKISKSLRASSTATSQGRSFAFEPTTTDGVRVYDARTAELPADMSTWPYVLPRLEEPYPRNAVAFVVHTTTVWIGASDDQEVHNLQQNLMYVVVVGVLPPGVD